MLIYLSELHQTFYSPNYQAQNLTLLSGLKLSDCAFGKLFSSSFLLCILCVCLFGFFVYLNLFHVRDGAKALLSELLNASFIIRNVAKYSCLKGVTEETDLS